MSLVLGSKYKGIAGLKQYYVRRFLRLYPAYIATLLLLCAIGILHPLSYFAYWRTVGLHLNPLALVATLVSMATMIGQDVFMFLSINTHVTPYAFSFAPNMLEVSQPANVLLFSPPAWALGIEIWFYAVAPLLVRCRNRTLILLLVLSVAIRIYIYRVLLLDTDPWTYRFFPTELAYFLAGMLSYRSLQHIRGMRWPTFMPRVSLILLFLASLTQGYWSIVLGDAIASLLYHVFVLAALPFVFLTVKRGGWDEFLGEISYPFFLSHVLMLRILSPLPAFVVAVLFSVAVVRCAERPLKRRTDRRRVRLAAVS